MKFMLPALTIPKPNETTNYFTLRKMICLLFKGIFIRICLCLLLRIENVKIRNVVRERYPKLMNGTTHAQHCA